MKRNPQAQKPKRNYSLAWRIFEAFIALFCLLATHQAIWVYFNKDLSQRLRSEYPNPSVWLFPLAVSATDTAGAKQAVFEVNHSPIDLTGFGPPGQEVVLKVEHVDKKKKSGADGRLEFSGIALRRGLNQLQAFPLENDTYSSRLEEQEAGQAIYFNPPAPLPPRVLQMIPRTSDSMVVVGAADPSTKVFWRDLEKAESYEVRLDALGLFKYMVSRKNTDSLRLAVWARPQKPLAESRELVGDSLLLAPAFAADSSRAPLSRHVTITLLEQNKFTLQAEAVLSPKMQLYTWVQQELITSEELVRVFFGLELSSFNAKPARLEPFRQNLPALEGNKLRLEFTSDIPPEGLVVSFLKSGALNDVPLALPEDEISLIAPRAVKMKINQPASRVLNRADTAQVFLWWAKPNKRRDDDSSLFRAFHDSSQSAKPSVVSTDKSKVDSSKVQTSLVARQPASTSPNNFVRQLQKLERVMPHKLRDFLHALLNATPFLWLLWILHRQGQRRHHGYRAIIYSATTTFLIYHITLLCLPLFSTSFRFLDPILAAFSSTQALRGTVKNLGIVYPFMTIGMVLLFRLLYSTLLKHDTPRITQRRFAKPVLRWLVFWPAAVILPLVLFFGLVFVRQSVATPKAAPPLFESYLIIAVIFIGIGLVFCWFFLYWLLTFGLGMAIKKRTVIRVSWAMLALPLLPLLVESFAAFLRYMIVTGLKIYPFIIPTRLDNFIWFIIIVWAGTALFQQLVELTIRLARNRIGASVLHSHWAWVLVPIYALFSLPMNYVGGTAEGRAVSIYDLSALALGIANLLPYALLIGLFVYLGKYLSKAQSARPFELGPEAISIGTILFAYYLIGRATSLLFAPLPILLGWFIFTRGVLVERVQLEAAVAGDQARLLVRRLLDFKTAQEELYGLKKNLRKKFTQGELDPKKLEEGLAAGQQRVEDMGNAIKAAAENEGKAKQKIFGHGPTLSPTENAKVALWYGLALSIPFQAGKWLSIIENPEIANYPLLNLFTKLLFSLSTWVVIAFIFGYFFHKIRGHDGFVKAIVFAGGYLVATIPLRLFNMEPILEQGFVVQAVQVLAYVLMLALIAFDLRTLQELGYGWRELLEVHGFTKITAYSSSIVLATIASLSGKDLIPFIWNIFNWLLGSKAP